MEQGPTGYALITALKLPCSTRSLQRTCDESNPMDRGKTASSCLDSFAFRRPDVIIQTAEGQGGGEVIMNITRARSQVARCTKSSRGRGTIRLILNITRLNDSTC